MRLAGFEPTTPWFVAKYSIQLSYSRKAVIYPLKKPNPAQWNTGFQVSRHQIVVRLAGFEPTTPWFVAKYSIQLSYSR